MKSFYSIFLATLCASIVSGQSVLKLGDVTTNGQLTTVSSAGVSAKNFVRVANLDGAGHDYAYIYPGSSVAINPVAGGTIVVFGSGTPGASSMSVSDGVNTYNQVAFHNGGNSASGCCIATNVSGSSVTVSATMSGSGDLGYIVVEYTGSTQFDVAGYSTGTGTPSIPLTTSSTDMFVGYFSNENTGPAGSVVLDSGAVSPVVVRDDLSAHHDWTLEWLNSSSGYTAGTWTMDGSGGDSRNQFIFVGLK